MTATAKHSPTPSLTKWLWRASTLVVGILIVIKILSEINWQTFLEYAGRLSPLSVMLTAGVYLLLNFFRCLRFRALLDRKDLSLRLMFPISLYHNFVVRILPFKLGEVWYVVLMRRYFGLPVEEGVGSLFASRMLELLVIVIVGTVTLLVSGTVLAGQGALQTLFILIIVGAGIPGLYFAGVLLRLVARLMRGLSMGPVTKAASMVEKMASEFDRLRRPRVFLGGLFWSVFTYACSFAGNAILLAALGIHLEPATLILAVTLGMFASAVPFNVAGFGMVEVSWTFVLTTLLNVSEGEAVSVGLLLNGFQILTAIVYGLIGYGVLQLMTIENQSHPTAPTEAVSQDA